MVSKKCGQDGQHHEVPWRHTPRNEVKYTISKEPHSESWHNTTPTPVEVGSIPPNCDYSFDFDEGKYLDELYDYIGKTYTQHYAKGIQVTKFIMSHMNSPDFLRGNVLKYTTRYGRKEGYNRNDILKAIHYAILMLYYHDTVFFDKKGLSDND